MIDFREYKTVPKTFDLEQAIVENEVYKQDNKFLKGFLIATALIVAGVVVYLIHEHRRVDERYN